MKLRVRNNSIRLRLVRSEVASFEATGHVEEAIEFGPGSNDRFVYALQRSREAEPMHAVLDGSRVTIMVSPELAGEWCATELVGMETEQQIGGGKLLRLLVEKDFACLEPRAGDEDAFPHPATNRLC